AGPTRRRAAGEERPRRPQRPRRYFARRVGRDQVEYGEPLRPADQGEGPAADRERGAGLREGQRRLAEADGAVRQVVVSGRPRHFSSPAERGEAGEDKYVRARR